MSQLISFNIFFLSRCLNDAADLELDQHAEAGVTLVEELLTDFLQVERILCVLITGHSYNQGSIS